MPDSLPQAFLEYIRLFNDEQFFEAHEVLEDLWRVETGHPRDFYQGMIQIAAIFVHIQKNNPKGAKVLLESSTRYLEPYSPSFHNISIQPTLETVGSCVHEMKAGFKLVLNKLE